MPSPLNRSIRLSEDEFSKEPPTYSGQLSGLYVGDVIKSIDEIPKASFDLIVADPPYNLGIDFGNNRDRWSSKASFDLIVADPPYNLGIDFGNNRDRWSSKASFDLIVADPPYNLGIDFGNNRDRWSSIDYEQWLTSWLLKLPALLSSNGSVYICCDWKYSGLFQKLISDSGLKIMNRITWKREKGRGAKANWKQNMEDIWFAVNDPDNYTFNLEDVKLRKKVGSSRVDLQACKLEYSIVSPK